MICNTDWYYNAFIVIQYIIEKCCQTRHFLLTLTAAPVSPPVCLRWKYAVFYYLNLRSKMGLFSCRSVQLRFQMFMGWLQDSWKLLRRLCFVLSGKANGEFLFFEKSLKKMHMSQSDSKHFLPSLYRLQAVLTFHNQHSTSNLFKVQMLSKLRCLFLLVSEFGQKTL